MPVHTHCHALNSGHDPAELPVKGPKAAITQRIERALHITNGDLVALIQRTQNPWDGMWILPPMTHEPDVLEMPIISHKYGITRYRVTLEIYPAKSSNAVELRWFSPAELVALPIPSPYRRVLEALA